MRLIYTLGWYLALPAVYLRLLWRSRRNPGYRRGWGQRLGFSPRLEGRPLWLHAVSVGETVAAAPLVEALLARHPDMPLLITSTTPTGSARVREMLGDRVHRCFLPFDVPAAVNRFLNRTRPRVGIIMETEIWPNLFHACARRHLPLILANARLSEKSARGYLRAGRLIQNSLSALAFVGVQSQADAERFRALGMPAERIRITGNLKFETDASNDVRPHAQALRRNIGLGPVWLAASTHEGEERMALEALKQARASHPDLRLLLVPRHPERFEAVYRLCEQAGLRVSRRSQGWADASTADVLLGDTMGELVLFYALSDLAFVGGSLVRVGGHNIIEAAAGGCPVIIGPHTFNMPALRAAFEQADALIGIDNEAQLGRSVAELLTDEHGRAALADRAQTLIGQHRGARVRLLRLVEDAIAESS